MFQLIATKIGNSVGIVIPAKLRKSQNIKKGDEIFMQDLGKKGILLTSKRPITVETAENTEVQDVFEKVNKKYASAFKKLANL